MSDLRRVRAGQLWTPHGFLARQEIEIEGGRVAAVRPWGADNGAPAADELEATDGWVVPGLVDLQVNGALGWSFQAHHREHFDAVVRYHLRAGTTTLLPTLITAPEETLVSGLQTLSAYLTQAPQICLPGIHLEGPFLSREKSGAHDPEALRLPDPAMARRLDQAAQGQLRIVTLAPELPGAEAVIAYHHGQGTVVAAGHSAATFAQMRRAQEAGLSMVTHAGNASDWPHRAMGELGFMASEPGVVGTLMVEPALAAGVILDGYHFHPALLRPLLQLKGPEKLFLVSDASMVAGCPPGIYSSGGLEATVHTAGFATSGRGGNWLAGSTITLLEAVQRAVRLAGVSLHQAVEMATLGPAALIGMAERKGHLGVGADADLLMLGADLSLQGLVVGGRLVPLGQESPPSA